MIEEIWKSIINYEGLYQISNYGRIKRFNKDNRCKSFKILKPINEQEGHLRIYLCKNSLRKRYQIHRLVLETFVGPCPPGMECRHLDGNPTNNRLDNLKWGTKSENQQDSIKHGTHWLSNNRLMGEKHPRAKLNNWKVRIINRLLEDDYLTQAEIGETFNVAQNTVSYIKLGINWK